MSQSNPLFFENVNEVADQTQHVTESELESQDEDDQTVVDVAIDESNKRRSLSAVPRATLAQKVEVINWHENHGAKTQRFTVDYFKAKNEFGITYSAFGRWLQNKDQLRADLVKNSHLSNADFKKRSYVKYALVDQCVAKQYEEWMFDYHKFSYQDIKDEWFQFAKLLYPNEELNEALGKSNGWMAYFQKKMKPRRDVIKDHQNYLIDNLRRDIDSERLRIQSIIGSYKKCDVFHFDEFSITSRILPVDHSQQKFVVGIGVNSDITEFSPPMIISNGDSLRGFENYYLSSSDQMNADIFHKYLSKWNRIIEFNTPNRKIILLLDRLHQHVINFDEFNHIEVCWFNSNFQTKFSNLDDHINNNNNGSRIEIQPLNLGIIKNFKLHLKTNLLKHFINIVQVSKHGSVSNSESPILKVSNEVFYELINISCNYIKNPNFHNYIEKCWIYSGLTKSHGSGKSANGHFNTIHDEKLEVLYYKMVKTLDRLGFLQQHYSTFSLDQLLFPHDEMVLNLPLTRLDIVRLLKTETQNTLSESSKVREPSSYSRTAVLSQLNSLDPILSTQLKPFFQDNVNSFPNSNQLFQKFLNSFIIESMDYQYNSTTTQST